MASAFASSLKTEEEALKSSSPAQLDKDVSAKVDPLQQKWDAFSPLYADWMQQWSLPLAAQLFTMLALTQPATTSCGAVQLAAEHDSAPKTLLDVGCGPGLGTKHALSHLPSEWGIAGVDLSPAMVQRAQALLVGDGQAAAPEAARVQLHAASAQQLPFADNSMHAAMSNLCLMLVPQPTLALAELRRVLRPGGRLAFSVWGDASRSAMFTATGKVLKAHGVVPPAAGGSSAPPTHSNFALASDEEALREQLGDAGFTDVIMWHSCAPVPAVTAAQAAAFRLATSLHPVHLAPLPACLSPEECRAIQADLQAAYTPIMQRGTCLALDVLIVVAQ